MSVEIRWIVLCGIALFAIRMKLNFCPCQKWHKDEHVIIPTSTRYITSNAFQYCLPHFSTIIMWYYTKLRYDGYDARAHTHEDSDINFNWKFLMKSEYGNIAKEGKIRTTTTTNDIDETQQHHHQTHAWNSPSYSYCYHEKFYDSKYSYIRIWLDKGKKCSRFTFAQHK